MVHTFTYRCVDCGAQRFTLELDDEKEEDRARLDRLYGDIDRYGEEEVLERKLCVGCRRTALDEQFPQYQEK